MRLRSLTWVGLTAVAVAVTGCGPSGPSNLEGFGEFGDSEGVGDGDGDPGDGDGDPGDGDGDGGNCIDGDYGSAPEIYFEAFLGPDLANDFSGFCSDGPASDYAVAWTAPFSGPFRANLYADFPGSLSVLAGTCGANLLDCSAFEAPNTVDFEAVEGQDYTFVIDGEFDGGFGFELYPFDVMPGFCPDGLLVPPQDTVFGSTVGGGFDFGSDCGGFESPDRSFIFYVDQTGPYRIDTLGSSFDTVLHVIEGECAGPLIACNDDSFEWTESSLEVELAFGVPYTVVVDGFGGDQGDFQLNVEYVGEQTGLCPDIILLPPEFPVAEAFPTDMSMGNAWEQCAALPFEARYLWLAPWDGTFQVTQVADGDKALTVISDGCEGGDAVCGSTPGNQDNVITFNAAAGQQFVFVSEWGDVDSQEILLTLTEVGSCGQDLGSELPILLADTTVGGGDDHTGSCASNAAPDREFTWTAPATGSYRFSLEGSSYDTLMFLRDGGCEGPEIACNDDTTTEFGLELWSSIELDMMVGQTVAIVVDGYNGAGDFQLSITAI